MRVCRRLGPHRAKVVVRFALTDQDGKQEHPENDRMLTMFLSYEDGCWTTDQWDIVGFNTDNRSLDLLYFMLAIDEAAGK